MSFINNNLQKIRSYIKFNSFKYRSYNVKNDLKSNEKIFSELGYDIEFVKHILSENSLNYYDENISWHYHIFSALAKKNNNKLKILEIGTSRGYFTNFLAKVFKNSTIFTIDLKEDDQQFVNSYGREDIEKRKKFIQIRNQNIENNNVEFSEMDSFDLIKKFEKESFDLIWVDGDHLDPQCAIDIFSSIYLLKHNGIILCDDVIKFQFKNEYASNESFKTLNFLENKNILKNFYFTKRCNKINAIRKKYISMSFKV